MDPIFYSCSEFRDCSLQTLTDALQKDNGVLWADIEQPSESDLSKLREVFGFHPLALEDTLHLNQRPKAEEYQDHLFIVLKHMVMDDNDVEFQELELFVGHSYFISVHSGDEPIIKRTQERLALHRERTGFSVAATQVLYVLPDVVIDDYILGLDLLEDEIEALGTDVLRNPSQKAFNRLFELRSMFNNMSRTILPHRDIINVLTNHNLVFIDQNSQYYLRDVSDHLAQVIDRVRLGQDDLNALMNLYVSTVSNQLNHRVNRLTVLAMIIGVFTVFTGFYGMNFEHAWPPWSAPWSIPVILLLILITAGLFLSLLRWRRWL
jgi:magnesium transporter